MKPILKTRSILALILAAALLFAAGCSAKAPEVPSSGGEASGQSTQESSASESGSSQQSGEPQSEGGAESESSTESESTPESSSETPSEERKLAAGAAKVEGTEHLYNITALIPEHDDMSISDFAMQDETHLLLLYKANMHFGEGEPAFTLSELDLETGEENVLSDRQALQFPENDPVDFYTVNIAGVNPPIVTESISGTAYYPVSDETPVVQLPGGSISKSFTKNGGLYLLSTKGEIYLARSGGELESFWKPGPALGNPLLAEITDTSIVLRVEPAADLNTQYLFVSVDFDSGVISEAYTLEETADNTNYLVAPDFAITKDSASDGSFNILITGTSGEQYVSDFPKIPELIPLYENGWFSPSGPTSESVSFIVRSQSEQNVFLWDFGKEEARQAVSQRKTPYDLSTLPQSADEFAAKIEDQFGIDLALRGEAAESWSSVGSYSIEAEQDEKNIYDSLATINGVLSCYPDGFFTQLGSSPFQIGIVNDMRGVDVETVSQANGLTVDGDPGQMLLRSDANAKTVFHEIGHVIFNKLCRSGYQSQLMGDFNELNPRDFIYSFSYDADDPDYFKYTPFDSEPGERYENIYFSSDYAKISNTEDVAELMGNLMAEDEAPKLYMSVHLQEKCSFLFDLIRRVFDTSDWPEETFWEKRLSEAAAY